MSAKEQVMELLEQILGIQPIEEEHNFFVLGGDSVKAITFIHELEQRYQLSIKIPEIFVFPRIGDIIEHVRRIDGGEKTAADGKGTAGSSEVSRDVSNCGPEEEYVGGVSRQQEGIWSYEMLFADAMFRLSGEITITGNLSAEQFECALQAVVGKYDVLRSYIVKGAGYLPVLHVKRHEQVMLQNLDFSNEASNVQKVLIDDAIRDAMAGISFENPGDACKYLLIKTAPQQHLFVLGIHHIFSDQLSFRIIAEDIMKQLEGTEEYRKGETPVPYYQFIADQRGTDLPDESLKYWEHKIRKFPAGSYLPLAGASSDKAADSLISMLPLSEIEKEAFYNCSKSGIHTSYCWYLGAFLILLCRFKGEGEIALGTPLNGRSRSEFDRTPGLFINQILMGFSIREEASLEAFFQSVAREVGESMRMGSVPFDTIIRALNMDPQKGRLPYHIHYNFIQEDCNQYQSQAGILETGAMRFHETGHMCDFGLIVEQAGKLTRCALAAKEGYLEQSILDDLAAEYHNILRSLADHADYQSPLGQWMHPDAWCKTEDGEETDHLHFTW